MTNPVGPPAAPNIQNIAERAERIVKRAENSTNEDVKDIGEKKGADRKNVAPDAKPLRQRGTVERLPADLENAPAPQKIEGRVIAVTENSIRIETAQGTFQIKTETPPRVRSGQTIAIDVPAQTARGDAVQVTYIPQAPDVRLPPDVQLPPTNATRDYPPVTEGQSVLATPQPISNYTAYLSGASVPTPAHYDAAQLLKFTERLSDALQSAAHTTSMTSKLQAAIREFDLAQMPLADILERAPLARPYETISISTNTAPAPPATDAADNVLTQAPLKPAPENIQMTHQKFSTNLIAALAEIESPPTSQKTSNPFIATQNSGNVLRSFQQIDVMAVIGRDTPKADIQSKVAEGLSKNLTKMATGNAGEIVLAQVAGATADGQTIVSLPPAKGKENAPPRLFYTQTQIFAPEGTQLLVNLSEIPVGNISTSPDKMAGLPQNLQAQLSTHSAAPLAAGTALPPPMMQPAFAQSWPAMQETLDILLQSAPQSAQNLQNTLPSPSPRMVSTALFFIAALKLGNIENWLGGKNLDAIESAGKKGLVDRLAGDFARLSSNATEQSSGQWKTLTLPMLFEGEISNIQLHVRPDDQKKDENDAEEIDGIKKTRFVLDLTLSRMGPMQIDGFLTPKTLDLILRNQNRLAEDNRQELMKIFANTLELTGLKGSLSFQNKTQNWVNVSRT